MLDRFLNPVSNIRSIKWTKTIAIVIVAPYLVLIPLFKYETWPWGHDATTTIFSAWETIKTLREDFHLPYRWQADDHAFNGNPFMLFYQPTSYIVVYLMSF